MTKPTTLQQLIDKGVSIPAPNLVFVSPDIRPDQIEAGACIMPGARVSGASTVIGKGSVIGSEGPATVCDCQIGRNVTLASGFFDTSVFLDGSSMGGGAHVRPGCVIEEQASGAHTVGLKQTVLLPFVTLGSLINFCDCLMAGGTSRKNHSEVGSSYIHFNFTPHQDKATASLIGDVVHGVLLDQPPIFLGGQGGLAGPVRVAFGTVVPAGQVIRRDVVGPGQVAIQGAPADCEKPYDCRVYRSFKPRVKNGFAYIAQVRALKAWYEKVRYPIAARDPVESACYGGAVNALNRIIEERVKRLADLAVRLKQSSVLLDAAGDAESAARAAGQRAFAERWPLLHARLEAALSEDKAHPAFAKVQAAVSGTDLNYLDWVAQASAEVKKSAVEWLGAVAAEIESIYKQED